MQKIRKDTVKRKHIKQHIKSPYKFLQHFITQPCFEFAELYFLGHVCLFKIPYSACYPHLNQNEWNFFWLTLEANYCRVQAQPRQVQQQQGQRVCASPQDTGGDILHSWLMSCFKKCQKRQNKKKAASDSRRHMCKTT